MNNQLTSRIITYPSTVEKSTNHTVVLIDANGPDVERIGQFLKTSRQDFDVYLYNGKSYDLEWLNYICANSDAVLIEYASQVNLIPDSIRYGIDQELTDILAYFTKIEEESIDN